MSGVLLLEAFFQIVIDRPQVQVVGDAASRVRLEDQGFTVVAKRPPACNAARRFTKEQLTVDLDGGTVTCPARHTAVSVPAARGGRALFRP